MRNALIRKLIQKIQGRSSKQYWDDRYLNGGNSGAGSYGRLAQFKREVLEEVCKEHNVQSMIELGCGDGNQLSLLNYSGRYLRFDISRQALKICKKKIKGAANKSFKHYSRAGAFLKDFNRSADLSISLDVIYHLLEDDVYLDHLDVLFGSSKNLALIYSSNTDELSDPAWHVKHRAFTKDVVERYPEYELKEVIPNRFPLKSDYTNESFEDFYLFQRR